MTFAHDTQRTLNNSIRATGVGLHSGNRINLALHPAPANTGIVFRRSDLATPVTIPARIEYLHDTRLCTTLARNGATVATVEHLLSALAGLGIDNVLIELDGPEVPIMDGSAAPFIFLLQSAGIRALSTHKRMLRIRRRITVREGDKWACLEPYNGFKASFSIDFTHPVIRRGRQHLTLDLRTQSYVKEISRARTFGFLRDLESLRAAQFALGGSLDNAVVLDDYRVLNERGLRSDDEFVRHKLLDAIGDLYLLGYGLVGAFRAHKSGHALNARLIRAVLAHQRAWALVEATTPGQTEPPAHRPFAGAIPQGC